MSFTVFYVIIGLCILWECNLLFVHRDRVKLPGEVPYRNIVMPVLCVLFSVFFLVRWGIGTEQLIVVGGFAVATALYMPIKSGLMDDGVFVNGSFMPYTKMQYYAMDELGNGKIRLRAVAARKEISMYYAKEQEGLVGAYFVKNNVPSFEAMREQRKQARDN